MYASGSLFKGPKALAPSKQDSLILGEASRGLDAGDLVLRPAAVPTLPGVEGEVGLSADAADLLGHGGRKFLGRQGQVFRARCKRSGLPLGVAAR